MNQRDNDLDDEPAATGGRAANIEHVKGKALVGMSIALAVTIGAWFFFNRATDRGLERLNTIDQMKAECDSLYALARTGSDTSRIDARPLRMMIDSGKAGAPRRCSDMRLPSSRP